MKTSTTQAGSILPALSKVVAALAVAAMIGGMAMTPAHADGKGRGHDKGWHKGHSREYRPVYREYYSAPVYVPAPVYYYPVQSPGISLFIPLHLR